MFEKTLRMALLFDAYGSLLTEKQQRFFSLYYEEDLSLGEIAAQFEVSRQAVYDILKRSEKILSSWEEKLHLVAREEKLRSVTQDMTAALSALARFVKRLPASDASEATACLARIEKGLALMEIDNTQGDSCDV